jgi:transcriptional regulator with XRE-family HTH domain
MSFGKNLCELLKERNVSSYKLAKEIGVHTTTVSNWKMGKRPQIEHVSLVANFFGCTVDELLKEE